jgi:hypothetical protein
MAAPKSKRPNGCPRLGGGRNRILRVDRARIGFGFCRDADQRGQVGQWLGAQWHQALHHQCALRQGRADHGAHQQGSACPRTRTSRRSSCRWTRRAFPSASPDKKMGQAGSAHRRHHHGRRQAARRRPGGRRGQRLRDGDAKPRQWPAVRRCGGRRLCPPRARQCAALCQ